MMRKAGTLILITLAVVFSTVALRNFDLVLTDTKCTVKSTYIAGTSCLVNKTYPKTPRLYIYGQVQKEIRNLRVDLVMDLIRNNRDTVTLFRANNLDGCKWVLTNITSPLLKFYKDMALKHGSLPQCPIPAGYEYRFVDVELDPDYLPSFVPNSDFEVGFIMYDKKVKFWDLRIDGRIRHKKKNKVNRKF